MLDEHVANNPEQLVSFARVMNQLLADAQERLVYRAHVYVQTDIVGYQPAPGDLAYPEKLEMMESIAETIQSQLSPKLSTDQPGGLTRSDSQTSMSSVASSQDTVRSRTGNSPADLHGMWYPPLRRALLCLSKLYRCVDRSTFQGLSQEILAGACTALSLAAANIQASKTPLDAQLFHIKHILILREQIAPFQVDFAVKEMSLDFSSVKNAAWGLIHKRGRLFSLSTNNALLEFLLEGAPQAREHLRDSRRLADRQLKTTCEAFIQHAGDLLAGPLRNFLLQAEAFTAANPEGSLKLQAFAKAEIIGEIVGETHKLLRTRLPSIQRSLQLYLANRETEFILFRPVKNLVVNAFVQLQQIVVKHYSEEESLLIACPSQEQISVLLSALLMRKSEK
uniref:EOG090X02EM n=1 Tax=Lynceus sp. MCZ IZ 141354 TaxID=1930659 RepID=A0A9N6ZFR1_9CRUS|nr:EOG090X02EM [Lynceus sp. MCZ IZ 141354]